MRLMSWNIFWYISIFQTYFTKHSMFFYRFLYIIWSDFFCVLCFHYYYLSEYNFDTSVPVWISLIGETLLSKILVLKEFLSEVESNICLKKATPNRLCLFKYTNKFVKTLMFCVCNSIIMNKQYTLKCFM